MPLKESNMIDLGTRAPDFNLMDTVSGNYMSLGKLKSKVCTLIMFTCNHCPYVIHVNEELVRLAKDYQPKGVSLIAISSNDVERYPQDSPEKMKELAAEVGYTFPYLYDESQEIAKAYDAACTPDFYIFDGEMKLVYRGRLDESRPGSGIPVTGKDLRAAIDAVLAEEEVDAVQRPSAGCSIKWKE
ncbi:MAG: thioredoxin family protein [Saprospiraceae bacterium]|nr:thioredoxin family protein [Saprospiraceae bacterium]